jgi:hypothetical protein
MNKPIKAAHDNLRIHDVRLRKHNVEINDALRPEQVGELSLTAQSFSGVQAIASAVGQSGEDAESSSEQMYLYTFRYAVGLRMVESELQEEANSSPEDSTAVEIRAIFDAEYFSQIELEETVLKAFARSNVGYHVWPYWRELVQSTAGRMSLPTGVLSVPFYFVPAENQKETDIREPDIS